MFKKTLRVFLCLLLLLSFAAMPFCAGEEEFEDFDLEELSEEDFQALMKAEEESLDPADDYFIDENGDPVDMLSEDPVNDGDDEDLGQTIEGLGAPASDPIGFYEGDDPGEDPNAEAEDEAFIKAYEADRTPIEATDAEFADFAEEPLPENSGLSVFVVILITLAILLVGFIAFCLIRRSMLRRRRRRRRRKTGHPAQQSPRRTAPAHKPQTRSEVSVSTRHDSKRTVQQSRQRPSPARKPQQSSSPVRPAAAPRTRRESERPTHQRRPH